MPDSAAGPLAAQFAALGLDWIEPRWGAPQRVRAFFATRNRRDAAGGLACADFGGAWQEGRGSGQAAALDTLAREVANATAADIEATRHDAAHFLPAEPLHVAQVHGNAVSTVHARDAQALRATPRSADAMVTRAFDLPLAIRIADCMPVLLAARHDAVVGIAHAGWRGLAGGVLEATLAAMHTDASQVSAWLGPSIGAQAFEVGADVVEAFCARDAAARRHFRDGRPGKWLADLAGLARDRLAAAGVHDVAVDGSCTFTEAARFHSWRRDGTQARMAAFIWQCADDTNSRAHAGLR